MLPQAANGTAQVVYYHEGVGTGGGLDKFTGGAFGEGIEANIRALYRFIVYNYAKATNSISSASAAGRSRCGRSRGS